MQVVLDDAGVAWLGLVGIFAEFLARATLAQEVPAPVELDLNLLQAFVALFARTRTFAVG